MKFMLTAVTGINWGDEGKGRVIDLLAENADIVARYHGSPTGKRAAPMYVDWEYYKIFYYVAKYPERWRPLKRAA